MDPRILLAHAVKVVIVATLAGLYASGRSRRCYAIVAYLWTALIGNSLTTFWPAVFFNLTFWSRRQALFDVLKLAIGLEIALKALRAFPGARATWQRLVATSLVFGSTAALMLVPGDPAYVTVFRYQPQIVAGTVWLFTITSLVAVHYRIPLDRWHRAILLGLTPYQLVFSTAVTVLVRTGTYTYASLGLVDAGAYLLMLGYWAQLAWRPEEALDVSPEVRRRLQLERA